jgi:anti-sigma factor RsiW
MGRPFDKHIDSQELNALVPPRLGEGESIGSPIPADIRETELHVASCAECRKKVAQYRQLVNGPSDVRASQPSEQGPDCPTLIDWHEVAAGLWPKSKTQYLIAHAARCAHCGPLLRAASADDPTSEEQEFLGLLKAPSRPAAHPRKEPGLARQTGSVWRWLVEWKVLVPAGALLVLLAFLLDRRPSLPTPLSGLELAEFAASTHKQHIQGNLPLEVQMDSQPLLNGWLQEHSHISLPASDDAPREQLPYRIKGARLIRIHNATAAYVAYQMQADPVSLLVIPRSIGVASGGAEAVFKKVTFHYHMIQGYKVVTWSVHGLTYALVSREGNRSQRSCMICHSAMRDRDLSYTPTPLVDGKNTAAPVSQ